MTDDRIHQADFYGLEAGYNLSGHIGKGSCYRTRPEGLDPVPDIKGHAYTNAFDFDNLLTGVE